jgi:hypothetical protein
MFFRTAVNPTFISNPSSVKQFPAQNKQGSDKDPTVCS